MSKRNHTFISGLLITENVIMNCVKLKIKGLELIKAKQKYLG